jgi:hypothetical protein
MAHIPVMLQVAWPLLNTVVSLLGGRSRSEGVRVAVALAISPAPTSRTFLPTETGSPAATASPLQR